jgi:hypothetical protein
MVTKKEVDKAYEASYAACKTTVAVAAVAADAAAFDAAVAAWNKYVKLKREYENGK